MTNTQKAKKIEALVEELATVEEWRELSPFLKNLLKIARKKIVIINSVENVSDHLIAKKTGISRSMVAGITTKYWEEKMLNKNQNT